MPSALITGATSGIGLAFARALAGDGHDLVLVARNETRLAEVADALARSHGVRCETLAADLADLAATRRVEQRLRSRIDVLVNSAGFGMPNAFEHNDVEAEQRALDVMVCAVMRLTHAALVPMLARGSGDIVNVSSVAGFMPRGTYGAHKAWVTSFSRWLNIRHRGRGVQVMALCPGLVRTEFHQRIGTPIRGVPSWLWLSADDVVSIALKDLRNAKAVSVPSRRYQAIVAMSRVAPPRLVERLGRRGR